MHFVDKIKSLYDIQEKTKKYIRLKDKFYHPWEKGYGNDPRNGGYEFKEKEDDFFKEDSEKI
jgi:hypothetical protein